MRNYDSDRVLFFSKEDGAGPSNLQKAEQILRNEVAFTYDDINDILELYNIKKYIDNNLTFTSWTSADIESFKNKIIEYGRIVGQFMSTLNDENFVRHFDKLLTGYLPSFWEIFNNQKIFKKISPSCITCILSDDPHLIHIILRYKDLVNHYSVAIKHFLLSYPQSAEILLSVYEVKKEFSHKEMFLPKILTTQDKEYIISNYLDSPDFNLNYVELIQTARNKTDFKISDKTRLKAKRLQKKEIEKIFQEGKNSTLKCGATISFIENQEIIKKGSIENLIANYSYSLGYIKKYNDPFSLFRNLKLLFEFLDAENRIALVGTKSQLGVMERFLGVHSQNEYRIGIAFNFSELTSYAQIVAYSKVLNDIQKSIEDVIQVVFTSIFQEKYSFANNARLSMPFTNISYFERVRLLAPEFESILKQYKLFVEEGSIDFELLQISSSPATLKEIPSLIQDKYIYLNETNEEFVGISHLFFSDQTGLSYVTPFKEKKYRSFFDLLANEEVNFNNYEDYQKNQINYLITKGILLVDENRLIQILNPERILILKDLYDNEVASFYHYPINFKTEAIQMADQNIINFESSLFSKPEQAYFNYFLNKSEYTNGLDLRNSYLHGTQANPEEIEKHERAYFTYLKLLSLAILKIEDDLFISQVLKTKAL